MNETDPKQTNGENIENTNKTQQPETMQQPEQKVAPQPQQKQKKHPIKTTLRILVNTLLIAIAVIAIYTIVRVVVYHKYDLFGYRSYIIMSGSMEPTIKVGDAIIVKDAETYQKGDVIAFQEGRGVVAHRIIEVYTEEGKSQYKTQGDFNNTPDSELIQPSHIQGKVIAVIPKLGNTINYVKNNFIIIAIIIMGIIVMIVIGRLIIDAIRRNKRE